MEQYLFYLGFIGYVLGGYMVMVGIWTGLELFVFEKTNIRKGIEVTLYLLFVVVYYLIVVNLGLMIFGKDFIIPLTGGMYGASIGSKLKELKKKKRRYS